jgi:hypothetical protein
MRPRPFRNADAPGGAGASGGTSGTEPVHHDHHTLGGVIAESLKRAGIATTEEADAFVAAWWEILDQDRRDAEADAEAGEG